MITVKYYFNSNILFTEKIMSIDGLYINKNQKLNHNNILYTVTNCYYELFEKVVYVVLTYTPKFQYDAYIKTKSDYIIDNLHELGYIKSYNSGEGEYIFISNGYYYFTNSDYSQGGMGYVCETPEQFLAIAAIREDCDIHQWFKFQNNEIERCECMSRINEFGKFEDSLYPTKLTPEEILKYIK